MLRFSEWIEEGTSLDNLKEEENSEVHYKTVQDWQNPHNWHVFAKRGSAIVGSLELSGHHPERMSVKMTHVDAAHRHQGHATAMYRKGAELARSLGKHLTSGVEGNVSPAAQGLWHSMGGKKYQDENGQTRYRLTEAKSEEGFQVHKPEHFSHTDEDDDRYYHVTPSKLVPHIKRSGLHPRTSGGSMADGFYSDYSKGKAFFADRSGVSYWHSKVGDHLEHQHGKTPKLSVVSFPKSWAPHAEKDELGTRDSLRNSYFSKKSVLSPKQQNDPLARHNLKSHYLVHRESGKILATSDSKDELEAHREKLHQAGKHYSWHTSVQPNFAKKQS